MSVYIKAYKQIYTILDFIMNVNEITLYVVLIYFHKMFIIYLFFTAHQHFDGYLKP